MSQSLSDIEVFVASADSGRLAHAARTLGITPAAASAALKRLEHSLGVRLILRTTRSLRLTQEGESYLVYARRALAALGEGRLALAPQAREVRGTLRITAPADFGRNRLLTWLQDFAALYPQVDFQVTFDDAIADFFTAPIDVALRYGRLTDSSLIGVTLAELPRVACAAPDYLHRHGLPQQPGELAAHAAICYVLQRRVAAQWRFFRGEDSCSIEVTPRWVFNDAEMVRRWAIRGHGVAYRIWADIADDVAHGRLVRVLPQWLGEPAQLNLVYTDRRLSPALRALIDYLRERRSELAALAPPPAV